MIEEMLKGDGGHYFFRVFGIYFLLLYIIC